MTRQLPRVPSPLFRPCLRWWVLAGFLAQAPGPRSACAQNLPEYELPPIRYSATEASNRVTALHTRAQTGLWSPPPGAEREALRAVLEALGVPVESQVLVFSKTSLQRTLIEPRRPRALYFSDEVYVGWIPSGLIEVAVSDPLLGLVFYRFDPRETANPPAFVRDPDCLSCHGGTLTRQWPGLMVRSVVPAANGEPLTAAGTFLTGHESPFEERWGGWYVTGTHGSARHRGNAWAVHSRTEEPRLDLDSGANLRDLSGFFPTDAYLRGDSDLVALMVLEHQVGMHNRLVRGALRVRRWMDYQQQLQRELGEPPSREPQGTALRVVTRETESIVEHLLFSGEAPLPAGGVRGAGDFERAFRADRRADPQGRSLKDLDLSTRLFAWRCSYLVHSPAFTTLPEVLKARVCRRLHEILTAAEPPPAFAHLGSAERAAIREILLATQPDVAAAWARGTP